MRQNLIKEKSFAFALEIVVLYKSLVERREYLMSKQLLRAGTSIGANVREAEYAQSRADFIHKLSLGLKEANETEYWLDLLKSGNFVNTQEIESLQSKIKELLRLLIKIIKTTKNSTNGSGTVIR